MFEMIGFDNPVRLIVGGLHGSEGVKTGPLLRDVSRTVEKGRLILCNLSRRVRYISTINKAYYSTQIGSRLLNLILRYRPKIYIELQLARASSRIPHLLTTHLNELKRSKYASYLS